MPTTVYVNGRPHVYARFLRGTGAAPVGRAVQNPEYTVIQRQKHEHPAPAPSAPSAPAVPPAPSTAVRYSDLVRALEAQGADSHTLMDLIGVVSGIAYSEGYSQGLEAGTCNS